MRKASLTFLHFSMIIHYHRYHNICLIFKSYRQKQSSGGVLKDFAKFTGKHLCWSLFFNKVGGLQCATLLKKRFQYSCFPVNFAKLLRTAFKIEYLQGLLLYRWCSWYLSGVSMSWFNIFRIKDGIFRYKICLFADGLHRICYEFWTHCIHCLYSLIRGIKRKHWEEKG